MEGRKRLRASVESTDMHDGFCLFSSLPLPLYMYTSPVTPKKSFFGKRCDRTYRSNGCCAFVDFRQTSTRFHPPFTSRSSRLCLV
jgi:hypothetical protein